MKRKTPAGLTITYAPFWLVWLPATIVGPERYPHLRVTRPLSGNGEPLTEQEALDYWRWRCCNYCTATSAAEDYLNLLLGNPDLL